MNGHGRLPPFDPGLQPERTALAWTRTACSLSVVGLLGLRLAGPLGPAIMGLAAVACVGVLFILGRAKRRFARQDSALRHELEMAAGSASEGRPAASSVCGLVGAVAAVGCAAALAVVLA